MKTNINLVDVTSSQIAAIGHDPATKTLAIQFKSWKGGRTSLYHYANVDTETFAALRDATSVGAHFGANIKPFADKYPFTRISA